jgi:putative DNA primase/helicase
MTSQKTATQFMKTLQSLAPDGCFVICEFGKFNRFTRFNGSFTPDATFNTYYTINPREASRISEKPSGQGTEKDITEVISLFADVDVGEDKPYKTKEDARAAIEKFKLVPSLIVDSGHGYQCLWLFDKPYRIGEEFHLDYYKAALKALQSALKADHTSDAARIFRLPGSVNVKNPEEPLPCHVVKESITKKRYAFIEFERILDIKSYLTSTQELNTNLQKVQQVDLDKLSPKTQKAISEGAPKGERSELIQAVINAMTAANYSEDEIFSTLTNPTNRISEKVLEKSPQTQKTYIATSISKAKDYVQQEHHTTPHAHLPEQEAERKLQGPFNLTELGNADRLVSRYGDVLRYCGRWNRWLLWDGTTWRKDQDEKVKALVTKTVRGIYAEAARAPDKETAAAISKHARASENNMRMKGMLEIAQHMCAISPEELDTHKWLLNTKNAVFDLEKCEVIKRRRDHFITKSAAVSYDPNARCPEWLKFLDLIMAGDQELITFLQKAVGYSMTGITDERCFFILYGTGRNGKSTFVETVARMLADYAQRTPTETLLDKRYDGIPNDVARLQGARFVYAAESKQGRSLSEERIKDLTGNDTISARYMRAEWFDFRPEFKLWLSTNHKPNIKGTDNAIWDRVRLIPFTVRIPDDVVLPSARVTAMFDAELPGILNWALAGAMLWRQEGLKMPESVKGATDDYRSEMDILGDFLEDCCVLDPSEEVITNDLYSTYEDWCDTNGEKAMCNRIFSSRLKDRGFQRIQKTGGNRVRVWLGIGVKA